MWKYSGGPEVSLIWNYRSESREKTWILLRTVDQQGTNAGDWLFKSSHESMPRKWTLNSFISSESSKSETLSNTSLLLM